MAISQGVAYVRRCSLYVVIPRYLQSRDVIGDFRHVDLGFDARHGYCRVADELYLLFPLFPLGGMVTLEEQFNGNEHAEDLFIADFHAATNGVAIGGSVSQCCLDEVFASQQQACALWTTDSFSAGETHEIKSHLCVLPEVFNGWAVSRAVVESRDAVFLPDGHELLVADLADGVLIVVKPH